MIVGLFTGMLSSGGIQRASQQVAAVIDAFAQDNSEPCRFLSLNDPLGKHEMRVAGRSFKLQGFGFNWRRFLKSALSTGIHARLVYVSHVNLAPIGLLIKLLRPSSHYIVAAHGTEVWERLSMLRLLALRRAFLVTAPSAFTANRMIKAHNIPPRKVRVLPWALDPSISCDVAGTEGVSSSSDKVLLTVGRMDSHEREKGIEAVIACLPRIMQALPNVRYVVVGDGDDRERLEGLARLTGVSHAVTFAGSISDKELMSYYRACDVFVMPSRQEGFGLVFLEAMAFAKPVVGGNYGGIPEVLLDGTSGFLVEYGDLNGLTDRLLQLLNDADLMRSMGEAGRRNVELNYKFDTFSSGLNRLLAE